MYYFYFLMMRKQLKIGIISWLLRDEKWSRLPRKGVSYSLKIAAYNKRSTKQSGSYWISMLIYVYLAGWMRLSVFSKVTSPSLFQIQYFLKPAFGQIQAILRSKKVRCRLPNSCKYIAKIVISKNGDLACIPIKSFLMDISQPVGKEEANAISKSAEKRRIWNAA